MKDVGGTLTTGGTIVLKETVPTNDGCVVTFVRIVIGSSVKFIEFELSLEKNIVFQPFDRY